MKMSLRVFAILLLPAAFLFQGCATSSVSSRAQEKAAVFAALSPAVQKHLQGGNVEFGYTEDMVYIALGTPNRIETKKVGSGQVPVWIYTNIPLVTRMGWNGLTFNSDVGGAVPGAPHANLTPSSAVGPSSGKYATQANNSINQDASDASTQLPDLPMGTLYVFFYQGKVFRMNIDS